MKNNSNIFERIALVAAQKGFKGIPELSESLGYKNPEKLYRLGRVENAKPSVDIVEDFSNKFEDLNVRWFISGKGQPFFLMTPHHGTAGTGVKNGGKTVEIAHVPQEAPGVKRAKPGNFQQVIVPPTVPATVPPNRNLGVPQVVTVDQVGRENCVFVPVRARAGYLAGYGDPEFIQTLPTYSLPGLNTGSYRLFEVEGRSMVPTLRNHEIVGAEWVESFDHIRDERVYVITTKNDGIVIKRVLNRIEKYGVLIAKSDGNNARDEYPHLHIAPEDILEMWYARVYLSNYFTAPTDVYSRLSNLEVEVDMLKRQIK